MPRINYLFIACLLGIMGCFSPTISEGILCGEMDECPEGMRCDPVDNRCRFEVVDARCGRRSAQRR